MSIVSSLKSLKTPPEEEERSKRSSREVLTFIGQVEATCCWEPGLALPFTGIARGEERLTFATPAAGKEEEGDSQT